MLLLDTIMVCELLGTIGRAERDTEDALQREAQAKAGGSAQQAAASTAAQEALTKRKEELKDVGGKIHTEYLFMAMESANDVIQAFHQMGCFKRGFKSGGTLADIKAASELLDRARNRMVQAIVTGKALGDIAAESVNMKDAQQAGMLAPDGCVMLRARIGTRAQLYMTAQGVAVPKDSDVEGWQALLESRPQCMAMTGKLEQCKRDAVEAYWHGDAGSAPDKSPGQAGSAPDKRKLVCVCRQHGSGSPVLSGHRQMHKMVPPADLPDVEDLTALPARTIGPGSYERVYGVQRTQLQLLFASWGWPQLAKDVGSCACRDAKGLCEADATCFRVDAAAARSLPGAPEDVFVLVGMCGNHAKDKAWKSGAGAAFVTVYADKALKAGKSEEARQKLKRDTRALLGLPPGPVLAGPAQAQAQVQAQAQASGPNPAGVGSSLPPINSGGAQPAQPSTPKRGQQQQQRQPSRQPSNRVAPLG
ncbi:hypothetical protein HYH03_007887 [Edaphochlamys debaryana]|uniref:Uncharacterized protein n=1 Tax=Edaphochlamys debaryana TaxID=47281 RepID=A0A835Y2F4_9CHLO|nr:hypothetical protein HYH03_007887 [Edaphochlamys debaryana]|eukprot:KAG2493957.1 hypothetical protein HYH03_007887 [Edaphochlamys debaryana]